MQARGITYLTSSFPHLLTEFMWKMAIKPLTNLLIWEAKDGASFALAVWLCLSQHVEKLSLGSGMRQSLNYVSVFLQFVTNSALRILALLKCCQYMRHFVMYRAYSGKMLQRLWHCRSFTGCLILLEIYWNYFFSLKSWKFTVSWKYPGFVREFAHLSLLLDTLFQHLRIACVHCVVLLRKSQHWKFYFHSGWRQ